MRSAGVYQTRAEEADADYIIERWGQLRNSFPFYSERKAEQIARKELEELKRMEDSE